MKYLTIFLLFPLVSIADTSTLEAKKGFLVGGALNVGVFQFPSQFKGLSKSKMDESANFVGPSLKIGYDVMPLNHLLLGLRLEGMTTSTSGMNYKKTKTMEEKLNGKTSQLIASGRIGYVHPFSGKTPVDQPYSMIAEYFIEGGMGFGKNQYTKSFAFNDGAINESYKDELIQDFNSGVFSLGVNFSTESGGFFELKFSHARILSSKDKYTGSELVNGGSLQPTNSSPKVDTDAINSISIGLGKHY